MSCNAMRLALTNGSSSFTTKSDGTTSEYGWLFGTYMLLPSDKRAFALANAKTEAFNEHKF